jgi:hypothetical protein
MFRRVENRKKWTRITLHGWFLKSPQGLSKGMKEGRGLTVGRNWNPSLWPQGLYSPTVFIGSTDRVSVLPAVRRNWDRDVLLVYRPWVSSTGGSGSTDTASVLPWNSRNSNSGLLSVLPTLCRFYRQFDKILRLIKSLDWDCWYRGVWTCREPIGVGD